MQSSTSAANPLHTLRAITSMSLQVLLRGRWSSTPCAPAWLSPSSWGNLAHTQQLWTGAAPSAQPSPAQSHLPAQVQPWGASQHRKHLTLHPSTTSDFLTSHEGKQSWYLRPLLLQVSGSAQISNTVDKSQQQEGIFASIQYLLIKGRMKHY